MECKIIVVTDELHDFEKKINDFMEDKFVNNVSVSSTRYFAGYEPHTQYVACITYN